MLILCTGTRFATLAEHGITIRDALRNTAGDSPAEVYVGDAKGVDLIVRQLGRQFGWPVREFEARWDECAADCPEDTPTRPHRLRYKHGRGTYCPNAGMRRNQVMVDAFVRAGGKTVLGFPARNSRSKGTRACLGYARSVGLIIPRENIVPLVVNSRG